MKIAKIICLCVLATPMTYTMHTKRKRDDYSITSESKKRKCSSEYDESEKQDEQLKNEPAQQTTSPLWLQEKTYWIKGSICLLDLNCK